MRLTILALAVAGLAIANPAHPEIGLQLGPSVPTGDARLATDSGISVGLTATGMANSVVGIGADVGYHYWPATHEANAALDDFLSALSGTTITGSRAGLSALQISFHMKLVAPTRGSVVPWLRAGLGTYGTKSHLELPVEQLRAAGWTVVDGKAETMYKAGFLGGFGLDVKTRTRMRLGVHVTFHHLLWKDEGLGTDFTAFTLGTHVQIH